MGATVQSWRQPSQSGVVQNFPIGYDVVPCTKRLSVRLVHFATNAERIKASNVTDVSCAAAIILNKAEWPRKR